MGSSMIRRIVFGLQLLVWPAIAVGQIGFADNQADRVRVWNADYYEVAFRKADGRILYMIDKTTGQEVSPGNVHGPWVMRFSNGTWLDGQNFSPTNSSRLFSYSWDAQASELTLTYVATGTVACTVTLTIGVTEGPELDTELVVQNQSSYEIELMAYPVQLSFRRAQIDGVYVPYIEGMRLLPNFFESYEFSSGYPGQMFADFTYTDLTVGSFAFYCLHDMQSPLRPSDWLILKDDTYGGGVSKYHHDYELAVGPGEQWQSPVTVLSIGSTLDEAMASYWTRSGHDGMPTLEQKLGTSLFNKLANAVLIKRDMLQGSWTFASFQSFLSNLPANNLLHLVAFWPVGFDEYYPDYLPPHSSLGTLSDLQNLVAFARSTGHLVMPYTNPTWWDNESPTLASLGTGIVARNRSGGLIYETYGGSHGGYVVSPHAADVIARQDQTRLEFTQTVPCDLLFEDQVGARGPMYDGNPAASNPMLYNQGLIDVAARSASYLPIMSEGGFDRLSWSESGYCNSHTIGWHWWPTSTYTSYPMGPLWAHENLYFTAHNLAGSVMANDLSSMTYYLSVGYSFSHDLASYNADWLEVLDCFQKHLVSSLVGREMSSFEDLAVSGQTRTTFAEGTEITANLTGSAMAQDNHVVAANGFIAEREGNVRGGVFTTLHGQALSGSSPHYLAFEYAENRIAIYQPRGDDGTISVPRPAHWTDADRIHAFATSVFGGVFARPVTIQSDTLSIDYLASISGQDVKCFLLTYCIDGDLDCDGIVGPSDYAGFVNCLGGPGASPAPVSPLSLADCLEAFDTDGDEDVDLRDFDIFMRVFNADR